MPFGDMGPPNPRGAAVRAQKVNFVQVQRVQICLVPKPNFETERRRCPLKRYCSLLS